VRELAGFTTASPRFMPIFRRRPFHSAPATKSCLTNIRLCLGQPSAVDRKRLHGLLLKVIGYLIPAGTLTSGGDLANLTAIVALIDPDGGGAVYMTRFVHHCVDKALHIAGGRHRGWIATDVAAG
jgi:hypothetical protein